MSLDSVTCGRSAEVATQEIYLRLEKEGYISSEEESNRIANGLFLDLQAES